MSAASDTSARLAVLIDANNAQPTTAHGLLAEIANYGTAHVKRAYGDWTGSGLRGWKDQLLTQSIQPIHRPVQGGVNGQTRGGELGHVVVVFHQQQHGGFGFKRVDRPVVRGQFLCGYCRRGCFFRGSGHRTH